MDESPKISPRSAEDQVGSELNDPIIPPVDLSTPLESLGFSEQTYRFLKGYFDVIPEYRTPNPTLEDVVNLSQNLLKRFTDGIKLLHGEKANILADTIYDEILDKVTKEFGLTFRVPAWQASAHDPALDTPISDFQFSQDIPTNSRIRNAARYVGCEVVGDLTEESANSLLRFRGFGKKCLIEVQDSLARYGASLKGEAVQVSNPKLTHP
jgi:hypothetical protein